MNSEDPHLEGHAHGRPIRLDLEVSIQFRFRCGDVRAQLEESGRWTMSLFRPSLLGETGERLDDDIQLGLNLVRS